MEAKKQIKKVYEKPLIRREKTMMFSFDMINSLDSKAACRQCSSCHGCR